MHKSSIISTLALVVAFAALAPQELIAQSQNRCFPTGHCIAGVIRTFWERNGAERIFGMPTSPQRTETIGGQELQVQWFERARLEVHRDRLPFVYVLAGRVGVERLIQQGRPPESFPASELRLGCRFYAQTRHNVCGPFLQFLRIYGGATLARFGLPLNEAQPEQLADGNTYLVQWFERARFELHPDQPAASLVQLGLLGNELQPVGPSLLPISIPSLGRLDQALKSFDLTSADVNTARTVTLALPITVLPADGNAILMQSAPFTRPQPGGLLGVINLLRPLPLPDQPPLPPDLYVVVLRDSAIRFIRGDGEEVGKAQPDIRELERVIPEPQTIITLRDFCYNIQPNQYCVPLPPAQLFSPEEQKSLQTTISIGVRQLSVQGLINPDNINLDGTISDVVGVIGIEKGRATLLAAPTRAFALRDANGLPVDGSLAGVMVVLEPLQGVSEKEIPPGNYVATVRRISETGTAMRGILTRDDGLQFDLPVVYAPVRAKPDIPEAILVNLDFLCCWFGEDCQPVVA